ncbi:Protein of unknown function [Gryllus bimaculatus]|nr:Protein of unknown function [Gryllus bimaculatus]
MRAAGFVHVTYELGSVWIGEIDKRPPLVVVWAAKCGGDRGTRRAEHRESSVAAAAAAAAAGAGAGAVQGKAEASATGPRRDETRRGTALDRWKKARIRLATPSATDPEPVAGAFLRLRAFSARIRRARDGMEAPR